MNITYLNESYATSEIVQALDLAREIITYYGSRGISRAGILVNLFGLIVLRNKHLEEKFYDCLSCRCVCNLLVCLVGSLHHSLHCFVEATLSPLDKRHIAVRLARMLRFAWVYRLALRSFHTIS